MTQIIEILEVGLIMQLRRDRQQSRESDSGSLRRVELGVRAIVCSIQIQQSILLFFQGTIESVPKAIRTT